jgi:hypothetical protein
MADEDGEVLLRVRDLASAGGLGEPCNFLCDAQMPLSDVIRKHVCAWREVAAADACCGGENKARACRVGSLALP